MKRREPKEPRPVEHLPTLYQYYSGGGIITGLSAGKPYFTLNDKKITILSGSMHYFRVPSAYWRDRLIKMRAAGLNTVETYVPWNLHEPQPGLFDFGHGESDFRAFLNLRKFLSIAQEEDLFAIVRPGPYICAEWEFGGMPSWLLRESDMKIRTSDVRFLNHVSRYFSVLFKILSPLQFTRSGPIIAFQIENEYGNTKKEDEPLDLDYLISLKNLMRDQGVVELLFTSDTPSSGFSGCIPKVLSTANIHSQPEMELKLLQEYQPDQPLMVMEYWTGWFDHWTEKHHTRSAKEFLQVYENILKCSASVNMYMFHGGTNWGFMNGANIHDSSVDNGGYQPDTTSYDYDAPLTENGDCTEKYFALQELNDKYCSVRTRLPTVPPPMPRMAYEEVRITQQLTFEEFINKADYRINSHQLLPMELLPINNGSGQSYGYIVYRKTNLSIPANSILMIEGRVCDTVMVLIDGRLKSKILQTQADLDTFGYWKVKDGTLKLGEKTYEDATLDIVVENFGRVNFGKLDQFKQHKGLWQGNVTINGVELCDWEIMPLEFRTHWTRNLEGWHAPRFQYGPALYKGILKITRLKNDTFLYMGPWTKGIVIVNGFVLGRYLKFGPQQTLYLPAPFLKKGENEIVVFEHFVPYEKINFVRDLVYANLF